MEGQSAIGNRKTVRCRDVVGGIDKHVAGQRRNAAFPEVRIASRLPLLPTCSEFRGDNARARYRRFRRRARYLQIFRVGDTGIEPVISSV
jgi:hypothetical protein